MYKLSMFQLFSVLATSFLPLLFWTFPRYATTISGIDGQWAVIGACIIALFSALVHGLLNHHLPAWSGADMTSVVYGKVLGKVMSFVFIPGYVLFLSTSLMSFSVTIKTLLPNTPRIATVAALVLVAMVGALYGLETIARAASIIYPFVMFILGTSFIYILIARGKWVNVFFYPVNLQNTFNGAAHLLPMFFGLNIFLMFCPYYDHRKRNSLLVILFCVLLSSIVVIAIYVILVRVIGYAGVRQLSHPIDFVLQLVEVPGLVIQRFGLVLIFVSTMFETVFVACHLWSLSELSRRLFNFKQSTEKWITMIYAVIVIVLFDFVPNQQAADWVVTAILVPLSWLYLIAEPSFKLVFYYMFGERNWAKRAKHSV